MKAWFGLLQDMKVVDLNRLLKSHGVRLVVKKSKEWGKVVTVTAHAVGAPAKRLRVVKPGPATVAPNAGPDPVVGVGAAVQQQAAAALTKATVG